MKTEYR